MLTSSGLGVSWGHAIEAGAFFLVEEARLLGNRCGASKEARRAVKAINSSEASIVRNTRPYDLWDRLENFKESDADV